MSAMTLFDLEPAAPVQTGVRQHGYIGRCPVKGCAHATRGESFNGRCPDHGSYRLEALWGEVSSHACNASCMMAWGPKCDCSCGGANHGAWHAR